MIDLLKDYIEKHLELIKLNAAEKTFTVLGISVPLLILSVFMLFFLVLLNIGLALLIGREVGSNAYGFLIMAGTYLLLMIAVYFSRNLIKNGIVNKAIKTIFKE